MNFTLEPGAVGSSRPDGSPYAPRSPAARRWPATPLAASRWTKVKIRPKWKRVLDPFWGALLLVLGAATAWADSTVVFHEIQYHPPGNEAQLEWIELHNSLGVDMDISGWYLSDGVLFEMPVGTVVRGGGFLIVASDPSALRSSGVGGTILGPFAGRLDNSGEEVELRNQNGRLMDRVRYRDGGAWPVTPDGSGVTLAKIDPDLSSPPARHWTASTEIGGTPNAYNFPLPGGSSRYPPGLSSYWSCDQASSQILDPVGSNTGTLGTTTERVEGFVGAGALEFDNSVDAFVNVGTGVGESFTMTSGITVEALVQTTWGAAVGDSDTIFRKEDGPWRIALTLQHDGVTSNRDVALSPAEQPTLCFGLRVGGEYSELDMPFDGQDGRPTLASFRDGKPHHVAATYNAATGMKAIYLDGALVFRYDFPPGTSMESGGTTDAYIGNMSGRRQPFSGIIDEVAIWSVGLSAQEIARHVANVAEGRTYFESAPSTVERSVLAFNEYSLAGGSGPWFELLNHGDAPVDLGGLEVCLSGVDAPCAPLPSGQLAAGERLVLRTADLRIALGRGDKLFLFGPGKTSVLDGMHIEDESQARYPEGTGRWRHPSALTPGDPNAFTFHDEIVIHEILYHPRLVETGGELQELPEEWLELTNRSDHSVDLTGWRIEDAIDFAFEAGTTLAPGEYLIVAQDREHLSALHPGVRIVGNFTKSLSGAEDEIVLLDEVGNPADEVHYYDGGRWPGYADGGGSSLELRDPRADNSVAEAWAPSIEWTRSDWKSYSYRGPAVNVVGPTQWRELVVGLLGEGEALIDDIRVVETPSGSPRDLLQNGDFESGASAWRFLGTHRHSEVIPDPDSPGNHVLHLIATGSTEHMHNHLETTFRSGISIVNGREYQISFRAKWLAGSNQLNTRLYFNRLPRTTLLEVPRASGTPGARNSTYEVNIGPTFSGLLHAPIVPEAGEDVKVSIVANDPDAVASATLWWNPNSTGWSSTVLSLVDDGGRYEGTIPGQASSALVQFYVEARDGAGTSATFPAGGRDSRAMFKVQDSQSVLGKVHNLRIVMPVADASFMHLDTNVMSNEWLPCTVIYDERTPYYDVGVRLKGSERGRPVSGRVGFHLKFDPDHAFRGVHSTVHVDRSGGWKFGGPNGQDEILIKHIVNRVGGVPGMYDDLIRVIAPRSAQNGSALLLMAAFSDVYLDSQYENGSDGTAYKLELIYYPTTTDDGSQEGLKRPQPDSVLGTDLRDLGNDKEVYRWNFLLENNRTRDDYSRLIDLCKAFSLPTNQLYEGTRAVMDVDEWMRTFTIYSLCGINDTYTQGNNHNNIYYVRPSDGKVLVFPWDMDFSFVRSTNAPLWGDQNLSRIISLTPNRRLFYGHMLDVIDKAFNAEYMAPWVEHYGSLAGADYSSILTYITARRSYVLGQIPSAVPFAVTTNSGNDFSVGAIQTTLDGNAWFDARYILLRSLPDPLEVTWTAESRWRTTVDLDYGANLLEFVALDFDGLLVGYDRITVTSTVGFPRPEITAISPAEGYPGDTIRVEGAGFQTGVDVLFGEVPSADVVLEDTTALLVRVPNIAPGWTSVVARNSDGRSSESTAFQVHEPGRFIRGDTNLDTVVDISDAIRVLFHLYGGQPLLCEDAGDANDDETVDLQDVFALLGFLFQNAAPPPAPFPLAGGDPGSPGALSCGGAP